MTMSGVIIENGVGIHDACRSGFVDEVRRCLDDGASPNALLYLESCGGEVIVIRKHVIGPPAEHPSRRIEHQAPLIASFLV